MEMLLLFIIGIILGWQIYSAYFRWLVNTIQSDSESPVNTIQSDSESPQDKKYLVLSLEEFGCGVFYCYDAATGMYVCQGTNFAEIGSSFKLRYPTKEFIFDKRSQDQFLKMAQTSIEAERRS